MRENNYNSSEEGWILFYLEQSKYIGERRGRDLFLPSPFEIEQRKHKLFWLKSKGFLPHEIASIMQFDMPEFDVVFRMVWLHGAKETRRRCKNFLIENEYTPENQNDD